jgi:hypothetical protein
MDDTNVEGVAQWMLSIAADTTADMTAGSLPSMLCAEQLYPKSMGCTQSA